jgi:SpoVK/Ycf46/Vps4 family AAA+-type ATPase
VGTTNYFRGIDSTVRRSGRFDIKLPVFPPNEGDRKLIFDYYLGPSRLAEIDGVDQVDTSRLARITPLFAPADIRVVVETTARRAVVRAAAEQRPRIDDRKLTETIQIHARSIQANDAIAWIEEAEQELGRNDSQLEWLRAEMERAYPG